MTPTQLEAYAHELGLSVSTWSPGDGATRYRFHVLANSPADYHSGSELFTALGRAEAVTFLRGFAAGKGASHGA